MSARSAMAAHDIEVNGITLHYATWGERIQPDHAVMLIHGLTSNCHAWVRMGPALAAHGFFAIAPDLRGRGLSGKPPHGYGIPYHANDLLALCDALDLPAVHLVGHSLGAQIALFLAALHSRRTGRIVLLDAGGKVPADALQAIAASLARLSTVYPSLDAYLDAMRQLPVHDWGPFWEQYYRFDAEVHADGTVTSRVARSVIDEEGAVNALAMQLESLPAYVRSPTLIVRAALGTLGPDRGLILPPEEAERMHAAIAGSRVAVIPDTNHYTILLSETFEREALSFLKEG